MYDKFYAFDDPFLNNQPKIMFDELDEPFYSKKPENWSTDTPDIGAVCISNVKIIMGFNDDVLNTAYSDLKNFISLHCDNNGEPYIIRTSKADKFDFEQYRICVTEKECVIYAGDTEGIRRGIYFIEDEMIRRSGAYLPLGEINRKPHIKNRITRNFCTPHEANKELCDDIDYYSDVYLSNLAHDGVNGIWIFLQLSTLIPSSIIPEYGQNSEKQILKLRNIAKKCAEYGIKVFGLGVEPASTNSNHILKEKHSDMLGADFWGDNKAICPSTEKGAAYTKECMHNLFKYVPELSGFISITTGESVAGCGGVSNNEEINCPVCKAAGLSKEDALAKTESLLYEGVKSAKPDAEFISWTYGARSWTDDMLIKHCNVRDNRIPLMNNFEDKGVKNQLGKDRITLDYWLSFSGPGKLFKIGAENSNGAPKYAKIQVCCSHELATVPYVPVPGILYDKYKEMLKYGTDGAMYCWFFGNYPGMMNKAAGELGFLPFPETKEEFLYNLAQLYTDTENDKLLAEAWLLFEKGYSMCPYNVIFSWFGPLNDAPARPLHLLPIDTAVSSNWLLSQTSEGDRFGEWFGTMHTPQEILALLGEMKKHWLEGMNVLKEISIPDEMLSICKCILILIKSACNVIEFYILRNKLGYKNGDLSVILNKMRQISEDEIRNSVNLAELCAKDKRLGYHSEAVGFKFFPEKLMCRVDRLNELINNEFPIVEKRIANKLSPLSFFDGDGNYVYQLESSLWENFVFADGACDCQTSIRVIADEKSYIIEINAKHNDDIFIDAEFEMFVPYVPIRIEYDGKLTLFDSAGYFFTDEMREKEKQKWHCSRENGVYKVIILKSDFNLFCGKPFRVAVKRGRNPISSWKYSDRKFFRLVYNCYSPDEKVFIIEK